MQTQPKPQRPIPNINLAAQIPHTMPQQFNRELYYTRTRQGYFARPVGQLGTCGWHPVPWQVGYGETPDAAFLNFYDNNPRW